MEAHKRLIFYKTLYIPIKLKKEQTVINQKFYLNAFNFDIRAFIDIDNFVRICSVRQQGIVGAIEDFQVSPGLAILLIKVDNLANGALIHDVITGFVSKSTVQYFIINDLTLESADRGLWPRNTSCRSLSLHLKYRQGKIKRKLLAYILIKKILDLQFYES